MAKISIQIKKNQLKELAKKLEKIQSDAITARDHLAAGALVTNEMKELIASGQSPIMGQGRFPAYKDPKKYPGKLKAATPVNLKLTGQMLDSLQPKAIEGGFSIGYRNTEAANKELGHQDGAKGQPKRPTIPQEGQRLRPAIEQTIVDAYKALLEKYLKKL